MGDPANLIDAAPREPVRFDPHTHRLTIGAHSSVVPDVSSGNEAILRAYLALVAEARGVSIGSRIELRQDDIVVLAEILDLADRDLESHLISLLGVSANDAADVHRRIRRHRALTAAAAVSVGGFLLLGARQLPSSPLGSHVHSTGGATTEVPGSIQTTTSFPSTTSLPPTTTPPPQDAPTTTSSDDIGDALVIERGQPPADPNVQIGDTVTYER